MCGLSLLLWSIVQSQASAALSVSRLHPDGSYPMAADVPTRFTFAPEASGRDVHMARFSLWVRRGGLVVVERNVSTPDPILELSLSPGRYVWGVQWWSPVGEASTTTESGLVVAPRGDAWDGVPWLGAADANEFRAEVNLGGQGQDGDTELLVATLGFGYVTVNGLEVSDDVLSYSGWTNTEKRILYRTYNVTALLNTTRWATLRVGLGCGYRCDPQGRFPQYKGTPTVRSHDSLPKIFRLQLRDSGALVFNSGSPGWMVRRGPVVEDSVYGGETYIADGAGPWTPALALPEGFGPKGTMVPATFPGVQVTRKDAPVTIWQPALGVHVVDFGSNVAGVCSISVPTAANISLKHGEILQNGPYMSNPSRVFFGNLRTAEAQDRLVTGGPIKDWRPRFTYHGFRYVEVYNYPGILDSGSIRRLVLNTAVQERTSANFSDEVLEAIHVGSKGSQRSNLMQVPTDCPNRDERLGWMGDVSLSIESMLLHFDMVPMVADFVDSMVDEMDENGSLPDTVPFQRYGKRPADLSWSSAFVAVLLAILKDGDERPAQKHWRAVMSHMGYLHLEYVRSGSIKRSREYYGDWCPPPATPGGHGTAETPSRGFAAAFSFVRTVQQAAEIGQALGGAAAKEARNLSLWAQSLRDEFHTSYYHTSERRYDNGAMVTYVLPLTLGAVPPGEKDAVFQNLVAKVKASNGTWTGGIINNRFLFDVLHENGAAAIGLSMLQLKTYPSYGYMYFNEYEPARECMWEIPDAPYQGTGMNSRNHHMYSSVGHYLLTGVAGLRRTSSRELAATVGELAHAAVRVQMARGEARFSWARASGLLHVELHVPVGMQAHLHVSDDVGSSLQAAGGQFRLEAMEGVLDVRSLDVDGLRFLRVTVGSGDFKFSTAPAAFV